MTTNAKSAIPNHVAMIMDGNGRWAKQRKLTRIKGHTEGAKAVRSVVRTCRNDGVKFLTLYAFSVANWSRPRPEVRALMTLLADFASKEKVELREKGIRLSVVGEIDELPTFARRAIESAIEYTAGGEEMTLSLALSYGGRRDIVHAAKAIAAQARAGLLLPEDIDESFLRAQLSTRTLPDVDLLIRTSGESRMSDFLLYEAAYAELLFLPIMWPEMNEDVLRQAFEWFANRERRFGLTTQQLRSSSLPLDANGQPLSAGAMGENLSRSFDPEDSRDEITPQPSATRCSEAVPEGTV